MLQTCLVHKWVAVCCGSTLCEDVLNGEIPAFGGTAEVLELARRARGGLQGTLIIPQAVCFLWLSTVAEAGQKKSKEPR